MDSLTMFELLGKAPLDRGERRIYDVCKLALADPELKGMFASELLKLTSERCKLYPSERKALATCYADWAINPCHWNAQQLRTALLLSNDSSATLVETSNPLPCTDDDGIVLELIDAPAASSDWTEDELDAAIAALAPLLF
jgi:hypothetical protein